MMRLLLISDPASPNGEDAFCREVAARAVARGHEVLIQAAAQDLMKTGFAARADTVLVNSLQPATLLAAKESGKPVVLRLIESYAGADEVLLREVKRAAASVDLILVPSRHLAAIAREWDVPESRVQVIPYAYDQISAQHIALVTVRAARAQGFSIVTAGVIDAVTLAGLTTVLSAVSRLRMDCHVSVIGNGPALPALKEKAAALMLAERVSFLGELPHLKKMEYLRAAKAFVESNSRQGFPSLALHALSEGCPVVGVNAGALPEFIRHGENGLLFSPEDVFGLTEHIITLATTPGLSLKLIAEGVRTVERHSWDATANATLDALESLRIRS